MLHRSRTVLLAAIAAPALLASGCQIPRNSPTEAELIEMAKSLPSEDDLRERFHQVGNVMREICSAPEFEPYFEKTPCLPSMITEKQKSDGTRIKDDQSTAMRMALREFEELNRITRRMMVQSQIDDYVKLAHRADEIDIDTHINQRRLLNGEITWGEYNTERERLARLFLDAAHAIANDEDAAAASQSTEGDPAQSSQEAAKQAAKQPRS